MTLNRNLLAPDDLISGKEGDVFVTIDGRRYHWLHCTEMEATVDIKNSEVSLLRNKITQHKDGEMTGKFKGKAYKIDSQIAAAMTRYKNATATSPAIEIQIDNEDPSSATGRQSAVLKGCKFDSFVLAKINSSEEQLEEDIEGTFDDWELPETFNVLDGLEG